MEQQMTHAEAAYRVGELLHDTFYSKDIAPPEDAVILITYQVIGELLDGIAHTLKKLTNDWETRMPDDKSLYSLGVRRSIDIVMGEPDTSDLAKGDADASTERQ